MKKSNKYSFLISLLISTSFVACNFDKVYERAQDIPKSEWNKNQVLRFDVPVTDTINGYDLFINIRNNNSYRYSNLFLFVKTTSPKGFAMRDTFEITLADDKGKWLGSGLGGVLSSENMYKKNVRFPTSGTYKIEIAQGMRNEVLEGIIDVGVRVEKMN